MKTAYISCNGCYEARMDCAQLQRFLELNGFDVDTRPDEADLLIFYACGLTHLDACISIDLLKNLESRRRPDADFLVWGCLPKIDPELVASVHDGPSLGRREIRRLEETIGAKVKYEDVTVNHLLPHEPDEIDRIRQKYQPDVTTHMLEELNHRIRRKVASVTGPDIFYIMTSRGCLSSCTYCSDVQACGMVQSKPVERVATEFKHGLELGFKRFHLVSTDLGAYGRDLRCNLSDLLEELVQERREYKLLLPNLNPRFAKEMLEDLAPVFRSGRISLLGLPAESGSDRILESMGRNYTVDEFKKSVAAIKEECPDTLVWTQLLVGFPGETNEDFECSLRLLDEVNFDYIQVLRFSKRPTIRAARFDNQVPESVSLERYQRLLAKAIYKELSRASLAITPPLYLPSK